MDGTGAGAPRGDGLLAWRVTQLEARVEAMDQHGSRGVQALILQVAELVKDVAAHEAQHTLTEHARKADRRWIIGTAITLVVPLYPFLGWILRGP